MPILSLCSTLPHISEQEVFVLRLAEILAPFFFSLEKKEKIVELDRAQGSILALLIALTQGYCCSFEEIDTFSKKSSI